jgi:hypothetical protein
MITQRVSKILKLVVGKHPKYGYLTYDLYLKVDVPSDEEVVYVVGGYYNFELFFLKLLEFTQALNTEEIVGRLLYCILDTTTNQIRDISGLFSDAPSYAFPTALDPGPEVNEEGPINSACPMPRNIDGVSDDD